MYKKVLRFLETTSPMRDSDITLEDSQCVLGKCLPMALGGGCRTVMEMLPGNIPESGSGSLFAKHMRVLDFSKFVV